jgi:hypothetical protein
MLTIKSYKKPPIENGGSLLTLQAFPLKLQPVYHGQVTFR